MRDMRKVLAESLTISVVDAGEALGLKRNAAYRAVRAGEIEALRIGGKWTVPTAPLRRRLGLEEAAAA